MTVDADRAGTATRNGPAIVAMLIAMASLILNDTLIKLASNNLPSSEIMALRGLFATTLIAAMAWRAGALKSFAGLTSRPVLLRVVGEVGATATFLLALFNMPIADVQTIMQVLPLFVVAGAAVFFREPVGWRRWLAAFTGFAGVALIIRPGTDAFTPYAVLALIAVGFVTLRDLATRRIDPSIPSLLITLVTAGVVTIAGILLSPFQTWQMPSQSEWGMLMAAAVCMSCAYYTVVLAMRTGEIAVVAPFRYSLVLWAMLAGYLVWDEFPDTLALIGTAIVIAAGLYTFLRERRLNAAGSKPDPTGLSHR